MFHVEWHRSVRTDSLGYRVVNGKGQPVLKAIDTFADLRSLKASVTRLKKQGMPIGEVRQRVGKGLPK